MQCVREVGKERDRRADVEQSARTIACSRARLPVDSGERKARRTRIHLLSSSIQIWIRLQVLIPCECRCSQMDNRRLEAQIRDPVQRSFIYSRYLVDVPS